MKKRIRAAEAGPEPRRRIAMPTYDYACDHCGHQFEKFQSMTATPLRVCPSCGEPALKRLIGTGAGIIFKGPGFYATDYRSESDKKKEKQEKEGASGGDGEKSGGEGSASQKEGGGESGSGSGGDSGAQSGQSESGGGSSSSAGDGGGSSGGNSESKKEG
jgi:putative FmdB family regulatory protein